MAAAVPAKSAVELLGIPNVAKNARDRLIDKAIDLFYRNGFHAIGLDRIIAEVGVTKTTFYKHFESKEDLLVAAVEKRDHFEREAWRRSVRERAGDDPRAQLLSLFDVLDLWFNDPEFRGCIFINAAIEFSDPRDPVHQIAVVHKRQVRDDIRDLAVAAKLNDPENFADHYTLLLEGTLILRHVHSRHDAAKVARRAIEQLLAQHKSN